MNDKDTKTAGRTPTMKATENLPELILLRMSQAVVADGERTRTALSRQGSALTRELGAIRRAIEELTDELRRDRHRP